MTLYWNNQGQTCCKEHAPYRGSDTWQSEQWQKISENERIEAAARGYDLMCEAARFGTPKAAARCA